MKVKVIAGIKEFECEGNCVIVISVRTAIISELVSVNICGTFDDMVKAALDPEKLVKIISKSLIDYILSNYGVKPTNGN